MSVPSRAPRADAIDGCTGRLRQCSRMTPELCVTESSSQVVTKSDLAACGRKHNRGQRGVTWEHAQGNPMLAEPGRQVISVPRQLQFVDCDFADSVQYRRGPWEPRSLPPLDEQRQQRPSCSLFYTGKPPSHVSSVSGDT